MMMSTITLTIKEKLRKTNLISLIKKKSNLRVLTLNMRIKTLMKD